MFWHIPFKIIIPRLPALTLGLLHESYCYTKHVVVCGVVLGLPLVSPSSARICIVYSQPCGQSRNTTSQVCVDSPSVDSVVLLSQS